MFLFWGVGFDSRDLNMKRFSFGVVLLLATSVQCLDNGLIRTPPMGWSTWNKFHCGINETLVKEIADVMAAKLSKFGYEYVNLDDCWLDSNRDSAGNLQGKYIYASFLDDWFLFR